MVENKQSNFIASVKMLNIGFFYKYVINLGIGGGGGGGGVQNNISRWSTGNH